MPLNAREAEMRFRRAFIPALLLLCGPAFVGAAFAQPSQKPIRIIVPFAPGASADGIARAIANELGARTGRPVVVENRVGAGGSLGLTMVAKAPPDGDTLGIGATGALLIDPNLPGSTSPNLLRELAPVAKLIDVATVVAANAATGPKSLRELIARGKTTPEGVSYGSTGVNTSQHISMEIMAKATGAKLVHVPYRGSAPAVVDAIGGQIPVVSVDLTSAYPHIQAGRLIALGIHDGKRFPVAPEIPTTAEAGVPGSGRAAGFLGLFTAAGTPAPVVPALSREVEAILALPGVQTNVRALTAASGYEDEATFASFLDGEFVKWKAVLATLNLSN
jgi:tripartite-type tricarboxylate transporter receptor subunit TctC